VTVPRPSRSDGQDGRRKPTRRRIEPAATAKVPGIAAAMTRTAGCFLSSYFNGAQHLLQAVISIYL